MYPRKTNALKINQEAGVEIQGVCKKESQEKYKYLRDHFTGKSSCS